MAVSRRVVVAMSGGVDSSVAAYLLRAQGYEVIGLFMRMGVEQQCEASDAAGSPLLGESSCPSGDAAGRSASEGAQCVAPLGVVVTGRRRVRPRRTCCSVLDATDARRVAGQIGIRFYALDFSPEFDRIIDYFVSEYTAGRTPNPCVVCNTWLKFGRLWQYARQIGADYIATGHYARVRPVPAGGTAEVGQVDNAEVGGSQPGFALLRGLDSSKDQSYVLFGIDRKVLPHLLLPVGEYRKEQVRGIAAEIGLAVADKPDSQEICFVPSGQYQRVVRQRRPDFDGSGDIVDLAGQVVGRHDGFDGYTVGQRKGLGVALGQRRYVVRIDAARRQVVVGSREDLLGRCLAADRVNWLCRPPTGPFRCRAKIRYHHEPAEAVVRPGVGGTVSVEFDRPQSAITPGQAVAFYDGDRLLGGGWIR